LELFNDIVGPTLGRLEALLEEGVVRDADWRNDFCRYLAFVREAFSGIAAIAKEDATEEEMDAYHATTDLP
jgi:proteasome activator subunit 4